MNLKKARGPILLVIGVLIAFIVAISYQRTLVQTTKTDPVVVVKEKIQAFQPVKDEQVYIKYIPRSAIPNNAIKDKKSVVGKNLNSSLAPDTVLQTDYIASKDGDGLAAAITEKKDPSLRVITLTGTLNVKGGYIKVGDHVDIIGGLRSNKDATGVSLASNVEVLALNKEKQESSTISFLVTVDQALKIHTFKTAQGDFEYLLRPYQAKDGSNAIFHLSNVVGKENTEPNAETKQRSAAQ